MANIILTLDTEAPPNYSLEVYKDISLISLNSIKGEYHNTYDCLLQITKNGTKYILGGNNNKYDEDDIYSFSTKWKPDSTTKKFDKYATTSIMQIKPMWKIDKLVNLKAIFNSLYNIFHWIPGERIINPEFGSKLYMLLYNGITVFTQEQIVSEIRNSVTIWEPRVNIVKVVNATDVNAVENNTIKIDVIFTVPSLDENQYIYSYIQNRMGE